MCVKSPHQLTVSPLPKSLIPTSNYQKLSNGTFEHSGSQLDKRVCLSKLAGASAQLRINAPENLITLLWWWVHLALKALLDGEP
jgi:hypothetical protein